MMNTRRTALGASKQTPPSTKTQTPDRARESHGAAAAASTPDLPTDDAEITDLLASLPKDSKTLVKIMKVIITKQFRAEMEMLREEINKRDFVIQELSDELKDLKDHVSTLESHIDRVEQYERRDTIIVSGPSLPAEAPTEDATSVVLATMKDQLKLVIKPEDVSVSHRLGASQPDRNRPIIVKLVNRSLKQDIVNACIQLKPKLYVNESLTPRRLELFKKVLAIRKVHRDKFQQCHTKDGNIIVKLKHSTLKHIIVDDKTFHNMLDMYPYMKDTHTASRPVA